MSLMNCAFTVRWSDEKNKPHAKTYATEADAKRAMKWSERDIKTTELLKILPQKPAFGDKSGMTRWLFFVKGVEDA